MGGAPTAAGCRASGSMRRREDQPEAARHRLHRYPLPPQRGHGTPLRRACGRSATCAAGKIRYFGFQLPKPGASPRSAGSCDALGIDRPIVSQPYYHALNRMPEVELLPACARYGLGVVCPTPLARGVLSGKYQPGAKPPRTPARARRPAHAADGVSPGIARDRAKVKAHAARSAASAPARFAVAWVLNNRLVTAVIAGPRTRGALGGLVTALELHVRPRGRGLVNDLVVTGHPSRPASTIRPIRSRAGRCEEA